MLSHEEFSCWIEIGGEEAEEYCVEKYEDGDGPTLECWIASQTDKQFTVHWTDLNASTDVIGWVTVNGKPTSNGAISIKGNPNVEMIAEGFSVSDDEIMPLFFKRIEFSDDDKRLEEPSELLGTILIQINRCTAVVPEPHERPIFADSSDLPSQTIHEKHGKEKNMMYHQVGAGPPTRRERCDYFNCLDEVKAIDFIFKYRIMDELVAMEIAPDPRSKNKRKAVDEVIIVSDDEVEAKTQRLRRDARRVKKRIREDSEYMPRFSSRHNSSSCLTRSLRRSTRGIKNKIRKEQDNIRLASSSESRYNSESSQDSDDPVQVKRTPSPNMEHVAKKIKEEKDDEDDIMSLASPSSHHNSSQDGSLHSNVSACSTQAASQSSARQVKEEEEDNIEPTPSSSSCHSSSQIEDPTQQQPQPRPSSLESSEDVHDTKCGVCESERIRGIRYRCLVCPDFDTCSFCFETVGTEHPRHLFAKIRVEDYIEPEEINGPRHSARCTNCKRRIIGIRYKCTVCPDYNLCEACDALPEPVHPLEHPLTRFRTAS